MKTRKLRSIHTKLVETSRDYFLTQASEPLRRCFIEHLEAIDQIPGAVDRSELNRLKAHFILAVSSLGFKKISVGLPRSLHHLATVFQEESQLELATELRLFAATLEARLDVIQWE